MKTELLYILLETGLQYIKESKTQTNAIFNTNSLELKSNSLSDTDQCMSIAFR